MRYDGAVVLGIAGQPQDGEAIARAADMARRRHAPLRLVYAYRLPSTYGSPRGTPYTEPDDNPRWRESAQRLVAGAVRVARLADAELDIDGEAVEGALVAVLLERCGAARLIVLMGERRPVRNVFACPVLVIRGIAAQRVRGTVVVAGIHAESPADAVLEFAFEEADNHRLPLRLVSCVNSRRPIAAYAARAVARWGTKYPDVATKWVHVRGRPVRDLVDSAAAAEVLVVGTRPNAGFRSVTRGVQRSATCAVALVPVKADEKLTSGGRAS